MDLWEVGYRFCYSHLPQITLGIAAYTGWVYTYSHVQTTSCPRPLWLVVEFAGVILCCLVLWIMLYPCWKQVYVDRLELKKSIVKILIRIFSVLFVNIIGVLLLGLNFLMFFYLRGRCREFYDKVEFWLFVFTYAILAIGFVRRFSSRLLRKKGDPTN